MPLTNLELDELRRDYSIPPQLPVGGGGDKRLMAAAEAVGWEMGRSKVKQKHQSVYVEGAYSIGVLKPGKEAPKTYKRCRTKDGRKTNNPNDMLPVVKKDGQVIKLKKPLKDVLIQLEKVFETEPNCAAVLASLLYRQAYMLDHVEEVPGRIRMPFKPAFVHIEREVPVMEGVPIRVYLRYIEMIGLNEDVKYQTLGHAIQESGVGRRNNLLTYAHFMATIQRKMSAAAFTGALITRRVAPIGHVEALPALAF